MQYEQLDSVTNIELLSGHAEIYTINVTIKCCMGFSIAAEIQLFSVQHAVRRSDIFVDDDEWVFLPVQT